MNYFAYGSNMSLARLKERVPSAKRIGTFILKNYELRFHMASDDGSGKCDAYQTGNENNVVVGALYHINKNEKPVLDKAESLGVGYNEKRIKVENDVGEIFDAFMYVAIKIDTSFKPYTWYLNHVITGAIEINLPVQYLNNIQSTPCIEDPNKSRDTQQRAIHKP